MRGYKLLQNGDILIMVDYKKLTHYIIPGKFSHAALCVDKGNEWEISEMTHHDYTKSAFFDLAKEADRLVILRCEAWDADYIKNVVIPTCKSFVNATYDVTFSLGVKMLYCSEMVYQSDPEKRLQVNLDDLIGLNRPYLSPSELYDAKNVKVVWDSAKEVPAPGFW